eukprot:TRINITY_DN13489_c0_g1_i5.p1 TRINITY_DN13489_c0_g1~~TRINITY_DN13489_c0_g1_i5.p1  ORF type:complete len:277 (-),score=40.86 TRINITY_DN13489_c0_g1_i5:921-1751(-)
MGRGVVRKQQQNKPTSAAGVSQQVKDAEEVYDIYQQVFFDIEMDDGGSDCEESVQMDHVRNTVVLVKNLASSSDILEQQIRKDTVKVIQQMNEEGLMHSNGKYDLVQLGLGLKELGHDVRMRTAEKGGNWGKEYLRQLHYQFLYAVCKSANKAFIIDPNFKSNFYISCASREYNAILQHVPEAFVGQPSQLKGLIRLLCGQVEKCFAAEDIYTPPWRKESAMLTKWFPTRRFDNDVDRTDSRTVSSPSSSDGSMSSFKLITGFNLDHSCSSSDYIR